MPLESTTLEDSTINKNIHRPQCAPFTRSIKVINSFSHWPVLNISKVNSENNHLSRFFILLENYPLVHSKIPVNIVFVSTINRMTLYFFIHFFHFLKHWKLNCELWNDRHLRDWNDFSLIFKVSSLIASFGGHLFLYCIFVILWFQEKRKFVHKINSKIIPESTFIKL